MLDKIGVASQLRNKESSRLSRKQLDLVTSDGIERGRRGWTENRGELKTRRGS